MKEYSKPRLEITKIDIDDVILVSTSDDVIGWDISNVFDEDL